MLCILPLAIDHQRLMQILKYSGLFILLFMVGSLAMGQTSDSTQLSDEELARKMANPNAAVGTLNFFPDILHYKNDLPDGSNYTSYSLTFQPALPKPNLIGPVMLFFRPAIPILFNPPAFDSSEGDFQSAGFNLGNISYDLALGGTTEKGLLYLAGVAGSMPTATDERIRGPWTLGPEIALGIVRPDLVLGAIVSQRWDVGGNGDVSSLGGQYFYAIPLKKGNVIGAGPVYEYNWLTKELTLPIGTGWSKVTSLGKTKVKVGAQFWYYVASPETFGQQWDIRLQFSPVVPLPW